MPDVGLLNASEPLGSSRRLVIKISYEVDELPVYSESYDVDRLRQEIESNSEQVRERWLWRLLCAVHCRNQPAFSACLTRCLVEGVCSPG